MSTDLTDKGARDLARQIVKDASNARVKFGTTNGRICLHVYVPGRNDMGRTIFNSSGWDAHPANQRSQRNKRFAEEQPMEALVANKDTR